MKKQWVWQASGRLELVEYGGGSYKMRVTANWLRLLRIVVRIAWVAMLVLPYLAPNATPRSWVFIGLGVLVLLSFYEPRQYLSDRTLTEGAGRVAAELGVEIRPGKWHIEGPLALPLGRELRRLNRGLAASVTEGFSAAEREGRLIAGASGPLQQFLRPALSDPASGYEPLLVERAERADGDPWPMMPNPVATDTPTRPEFD
ncbi:hypothetical protein [Propionicimonas sp.]|uniref:hypothetical protein n=1 Tax=Propionicimonas sp. TaxID=1955623 RepID=UPI0018088B52|nr:hypothetical protein [Propionicimonas sp.]MBU3975735.1 hypothetical protein [Actinomycetota bacterium]MBA3019862.1 hypothetical protein [Propionicimonas sp.]MBU3986116.1 hypothetical protein [Actinomycetota bacterium]MBU4007451.1 hypothetical protein [Actinomycetota bacterium]MBU4063943.1 hypothetical protein [Actinomycetota bacterium]